MTVRALFLAAVAVCVPAAGFAAPAGPAASASSHVVTGTLPGGSHYTIYQDGTLGVSAIDLWFRAPSAGYTDATPGLARLAAAAAAAAPLESGRSLAEFVHSVGGALMINVYPDIVGVSVEVPAAAARRAVASATAAYFSPSIDDSALKAAQRDAAILAVQEHYSPEAQLHDALFAELFASGPAHVAPLPDSMKALSSIPLTDVSAFAKRAFRANNALLSLAGNVEAGYLDAVATVAPASLTPDAPIDSSLASAPPPNTTESAPVSGTGIAWVGPAIHDERAATALDFVADYLFRDPTGVVAKSVGGETFVSGQFITLHDPGILLVTIEGDKDGTARQHVLDAIDTMRQPLDAARFASARAAFLYNLASDTQTPLEQADNFGWYFAEGNPSYAPGEPSGMYASYARALDPAYVASIVKKYLTHPVVVRLVAAKESNS